MKKMSRAGDIAAYLKKLFNEDHDPDPGDIAVLADILSIHLDDSDESQPEPQEPQPEPVSRPFAICL